MPTILAIETSSELASAALLVGDRVLARASSGVQTHSQTILPMVQALLAEAGIALSGCDAVAFGAGPGSFTGVRTACGIAQGLAFGADLPVVPVVTLMAMAQACREGANAVQQPDILAILDARMNEVYWAQYRYTDGWQTIIAPTLSAPTQVAPLGNVLPCGNGLTAYASVFDSMNFNTPLLSADMPHAAQVARLAAVAFARGEAVAAGDAQPFYLRNKIALTTAERTLAKAVEAAA